MYPSRRGLAPAFASRQAGKAFLGYLTAQKRDCSASAVSSASTGPSSSAHGYDTKYAVHGLHLGYQSRELLETRRVSLPMREHMRGSVSSPSAVVKWP